MADRNWGPLLSAADEVADQIEAEARADERAAAAADIAALNAQVATLTGELAATKAALADCMASHPPPVAATVFGASKPDDLATRLNIDTVPISRAYLGPGKRPVTWQTGTVERYISHTTDAIWVSAKDDPGDVETGWLRRFVASFADAPVELIYTQNHEPENGDFTDPAVYQDRWARVAAICADYPFVTCGPVLMNSQPLAANDAYWPTVPVDFAGWDCYNPGIQTPTRYEDPEEVYAKVIAQAARRGLPLYIGETGTGKTQGDTSGVGRAAWAKDARDHLAANGVAVALWWNSGGCALDTATAAAWLR